VFAESRIIAPHCAKQPGFCLKTRHSIFLNWTAYPPRLLLTSLHTRVRTDSGMDIRNAYRGIPLRNTPDSTQLSWCIGPQPIAFPEKVPRNRSRRLPKSLQIPPTKRFSPD